MIEQFKRGFISVLPNAYTCGAICACLSIAVLCVGGLTAFLFFLMKHAQ